MVTFPHGETNVTLTCQNRCVSCNHFIPMQDAWYCKPSTVERDLSMAARVMHFEIYNFVGGEPTLHPALLDLLDILRRSRITDRIEITSNGQSYKKWPDEFYRKINDLIVTPYKLIDDDLKAIAEKCREFGVRFEIHPVIFTYAAAKKVHTPETANQLYKQCWYNINRHVIDEGYFYRCCTAPFIPSVLLGLPKEYDGLALEGTTEQKLLGYMRQEQTPAACSVCLSNRGAVLPWRETSRDNWLGESLA